MKNASRSRMTGNNAPRRGFTLVELAIVLAVAGLMFVGLWRLLASGNQQVRDQSSASQIEQVISAAKAYLASSTGQTFMQPLGPNATANIPIASIATYLPAGFAGTTNSYGQGYTIQVLKDGTLAGTIPTTYSFMVVTTGGDAIPDTSGGRISAFIGNDGGFIYGTNVCNAAFATWACGAYGAWAISTATYGPWLVGIASGHIATRTFVSPTSDSTLPWLERNTFLLQPDPSFTWNTMTTDLFMGGTSSQGTGTAGNIYLFPPAGSPSIGAATPGSINLAAPGAATGGGAINMAAGTVNMQGGLIQELNDNNNAAQISMVAQGALHTQPFVALSTNCTSDNQNPNLASLGPTDPNCRAGLQVTGDANVVGQMQAWDFYATTFIYKGSDIRLKTDIHPIPDPLDSVMRLKPVAYTLKANGKPSMGVIAQDLEKVYPQLVAENKTGMLSVEYEGLIAPLIGAVQELKKENDELRQELKSEKSRQQKLEDELRANKAPAAPPAPGP